jgi:hypothetical protein
MKALDEKLAKLAAGSDHRNSFASTPCTTMQDTNDEEDDNVKQ